MFFMPLGREQDVAVVVGILVEHHDRMAGLGQYQSCAGIADLEFVAKNTAVLLRPLVDIGHSPRSPQLLHPATPSSSAPSKALPSTRRRSSLPTLKNGTRFADTETKAPLFGLRPWRARRCLTTKLPKPRISMRSPWASASTIESKMALMITSESLLERCGNLLLTSSIKSRFVITFPSRRTKIFWLEKHRLQATQRSRDKDHSYRSPGRSLPDHCM